MTRSFLIRIQSVYDTLKTAEKKAADYMLAHPERVAEDTVGQTARAAGCSEATYTRIARKLGFAGYAELRAAIADGDAEADALGEAGSPGDEMETARQVFRAAIQILNDTQELLEEDAYRQALDMLYGAGRYLFLGVGDGYAAAYTVYLKFLRAGLDARCPQDYDVQLLEAALMQKGDAVLLVSQSGHSYSVSEAAKVARARGARVITITDYPTSPIARQSDVVLRTAAFLSDAAGEVITKRLPAQCILESLSINLVLKKKRQPVLNVTEQALKTNKIP